MNATDLHHRLATAAAEMDGTDLTDLGQRVLRRSGQIRRNRAIGVTLTSALAVAVTIALAAVVVIAVRPSGNTPLVPPSSTPSETSAPSAVPSLGPSEGLVQAVPAKLPGALLYLEASSGKTLVVRRVVNGVVTTAMFGTASQSAEYSASPAPNGELVAIIDGPDIAGTGHGDLVVIEAGDKRRTLARNLMFIGPKPVWSPDSRTVVMNGQRYDVATGVARKINGLPPGTVEKVVLSPSGTFAARYAGSGAVTVSKPDGSAPRTVKIMDRVKCHPDYGDIGGCPVVPTAVSDDGRYVATGYAGTGAGDVNRAEAIVDTQEKRQVTVQAIGSGPWEQVYFRTDGRALVQTLDHQWQLVDMATWKVLATYPNPEVGGRLAGYAS
jgi:hypothetical protein